jgi:hypothetical protein
MNPLPLVLAVVLLAAASPAGVGGHYIPKVNDGFHYTETVNLGSGSGNYSGYTESTSVNGLVVVTAVDGNRTESASYSNTDSWSNNSGSEYQWSSSGVFTFSATTFLYVQGTDNQTGYTNPLVWFYMNNSLAPGATLYLLNTPMNVVSTDYVYSVGSPLNQAVKTIFVEGNGTFQRNDVYGDFTATYNWKAYFDPSTGYVVGYLYSESDTNGLGDGFAIADTLYVTSTSYPLTSASSSPSGISETLVIALVVVVVVVVIVVIALLARSRRTAKLPQHSGRGNIGFGPPPVMPPMGAPPPVRLTPSGQPPVQQVIIRETVKVPCRYCGTLIDSTATVCPNCGAPRT